jgi:hypothetical protein
MYFRETARIARRFFPVCRIDHAFPTSVLSLVDESACLLMNAGLTQKGVICAAGYKTGLRRPQVLLEVTTCLSEADSF